MEFVDTTIQCFDKQQRARARQQGAPFAEAPTRRGRAAAATQRRRQRRPGCAAAEDDDDGMAAWALVLIVVGARRCQPQGPHIAYGAMW